MKAKEELIECLMKVKLPYFPTRPKLLLMGECEKLADAILGAKFVRVADIKLMYRETRKNNDRNL